MLAACDVGNSGVKGYMDGQEARAAWKKKAKGEYFIYI